MILLVSNLHLNIVKHIKIKLHTTSCLTELRCAIFNTSALFPREGLDVTCDIVCTHYVFIRIRTIL